ncbi:MAG TPA: SigB/SigF/SigG family RNA polymerase sigma factor [Solirubrobacteraceae bacterium]|nr:SigB/SigF/SigG family RNA polymerase sigma factor [Solirubrobacteraceae bacterium]
MDRPRGTRRESQACQHALPLAERDLFARSRDGDCVARERLVERFLPLATGLARRYERSGEPIDDLEQVASLGLIKAVDSFDPDRGAAFGAYAVPMILGEIRHHFRDHTWVLHVPCHTRELTLRVTRAVRQLTEQLHREPSVREIAAAIGATREDVLRALQASGARRALSFGEACRSGRREDSQHATLGDVLGFCDEGFARAEDRAVLASLLQSLSARQRVVLYLRFDRDMTQAQIASVVGLSQMHVSRIIGESLVFLRSSAGTPSSWRLSAG